MISAASNIKNSAEELKKMPMRHLYDAIRNPREQTLSLLRQLRIVRQLEPSQYSSLKQRLPYFVCAMFNPPFRRVENFAYTEYFIVDIDHMSEKGIVVSDLRKKIEADSRTVLSFISPGGDGLKVIMKLSERCYDAGLYKTFYKVFLAKHSHQYAIDPEVDVSLAFDLKREAEKKERESANGKQNREKTQKEPCKDILEQIRKTLNMKSRQSKMVADAYVPEQLDDIMTDLKKYVEEKGIILSAVINIQYAKKLRFKVANMQAEINLFYGKRGFTVVQSPRTGTDKDANELMADVIKCFLMDYA